MKFVKIWLMFVVLIFIGGLFYFAESFSANSAENMENVGNVAIGGHFELTDQHGKKVSDADFKGKLLLVYFGFTNCPGECPVDMAMMSEALRTLGKDAEKIAPIFITIDPKHDNPKKLLEYLKDYYPTFTALTGTEKQIKLVEQEYKVYAEESSQPGVFNHSSYIYLMDRGGEYLTHFSPGADAGAIATEIKKHL